MDKWYGSAAICINENSEVLMVKQGKPHERKVWAVPAGGQEENESFEECCIREVYEETGYHVELLEKLHVKEGVTYGIPVEVHYFIVKVIGGQATIHDPDELIYEIKWQSLANLKTLDLSFPEDRELLLALLSR